MGICLSIRNRLPNGSSSCHISAISRKEYRILALVANRVFSDPAIPGAPTCWRVTTFRASPLRRQLREWRLHVRTAAAEQSQAKACPTDKRNDRQRPQRTPMHLRRRTDHPAALNHESRTDPDQITCTLGPATPAMLSRPFLTKYICVLITQSCRLLTFQAQDSLAGRERS